MSQEEKLEQYFHRFSHDINCLNDQVSYNYFIYVKKII